LFERTGSDPAWRHFENNTVYGRPGRELVLALGRRDRKIRLPDGLALPAGRHHRGRRRATGVIETKATTQQNAAAHAMNPTGMNALRNTASSSRTTRLG